MKTKFVKRTIYTIRVVYKSGYTHDFDVYSFSFEDGFYSWEAVDVSNKPVVIGGTEIAAVWQVGTRTRIDLVKE